MNALARSRLSRPSHRLLGLAALLLLGPPLLGTLLTASPARGAEVTIDSPSFTYDNARQVYRYDAARVQIQDTILEADTVEIDVQAALVRASGRVHFQNKNVTGAAERVEIDTVTGRATLYNAEVFDAGSGYFLRGDQVLLLDGKHYEGTACTLTNCRPGEASWTLHTGHLNYQVDSYASGTDASLWLGGIPVLWSPWFAWPTVEDRRSGFLAPSVSSHTSGKSRFSTGDAVAVPYFLALGFDHDLTVTPQYYSERGTPLELDYNYAFAEEQKGRLSLWGISETQHRNLGDENQIPGAGIGSADRTPDRYWMRFGHNQAIDPSTQAVATLIRTSDGQVLREYENIRDYRPAEEYAVSLTRQERWGNTALSAAHASEYTAESLFANGENFTDGALRPQILPRLSYNGGVQPFSNLALGMELNGSVTRFSTEEGASGTADVASPALSYPVRLFGSAELRPTVQRHFVRYGDLSVSQPVLAESPASRPPWLEDAESLGGEESFGQNEAEIEFLIPFARTFWPDGERWQALKHRITPRLIFRELEDVPQPLAGLLLPPEPALKLVTLRLDNDLIGLAQGATSTVGSTLAYLNFIQRYNLLLVDKEFVPIGPPLPSPGETEPGLPLLPLIVEAGVNLSGIGVNSLLRYHYQESRIVEYRVGMDGSASVRAKYGIEYTENQFAYRTPENLLVAEGNHLDLNGTLQGADTLGFGADTSVDLRSRNVPLGRRLTKAEAFVDFHPSCYGIRLSYVEEVNLTQDLNPATGQEEDSYYLDKRFLLTFNLGGVVSSGRGFSPPSNP
jgi:hypothetical protein